MGKWICRHKLIFQYFFFNNCLQNIWQKKTPRGMRIFFTLGLSTKFTVCMQIYDPNNKFLLMLDIMWNSLFVSQANMEQFWKRIFIKMIIQSNPVLWAPTSIWTPRYYGQLSLSLAKALTFSLNLTHLIWTPINPLSPNVQI